VADGWKGVVRGDPALVSSHNEEGRVDDQRNSTSKGCFGIRVPYSGIRPRRWPRESEVGGVQVCTRTLFDELEGRMSPGCAPAAALISSRDGSCRLGQRALRSSPVSHHLRSARPALMPLAVFYSSCRLVRGS